MPKSNPEILSVYLIAGEASGDSLGAGLMSALRERTQGKVVFSGIGGDKMQAEGLRSLFPYHELSLMGFAEIVPHIARLIARINLVVEDIRIKQPDVLITIDSPGFCYRVAKKLKESGDAPDTRLVHYVAPTVWAYKPERAKKFAGIFDHLLVLLPFEPPYFESEGLKTTFVGHPAACEMVPADAAAFRQEHSIPADLPLLCLLPGSRRNELKRHLPVFARALMLLARQMKVMPGVVVPVPSYLLGEVAEAFEHCPFPAIIVGDEEEKRNAMAASNFALVKSGTVSLEVAMAGIPMVVTYRANALTAAMVRRMIRIRHINLLNILLQREAVPELVQELCEPMYLAEALAALINDPLRTARQLQDCQLALSQMRPPHGHPNFLAADAVMQVAKSG